jgi:hypothetical protein
LTTYFPQSQTEHPDCVPSPSSARHGERPFADDPIMGGKQAAGAPPRNRQIGGYGRNLEQLSAQA